MALRSKAPRHKTVATTRTHNIAVEDPDMGNSCCITRLPNKAQQRPLQHTRDHESTTTLFMTSPTVERSHRPHPD